jgi:hypothetical protein
MPLALEPRSKTWPVRCRHDPRLSRLSFFCLYVMYISIFLHMLMYKDIGKLVSLHPCIPVPRAAASWDSSAWGRHAVCPRKGAPIVDRHD